MSEVQAAGPPGGQDPLTRLYTLHKFIKFLLHNIWSLERSTRNKGMGRVPKGPTQNLENNRERTVMNIK
jgi:hypothetical protein